MSTVEQLIAGAVFVVVGAVLVVGTRRRWDWLVDPPEDLWFLYSGSFIKKFCGTDVLELLNIYVGIACIVRCRRYLGSETRRTGWNSDAF